MRHENWPSTIAGHIDAARAAVDQFLTGRGASVLAEFTEIESGTKNDRPQLTPAKSISWLKSASTCRRRGT